MAAHAYSKISVAQWTIRGRGRKWLSDARDIMVPAAIPEGCERSGAGQEAASIGRLTRRSTGRCTALKRAFK